MKRVIIALGLSVLTAGCEGFRVEASCPDGTSPSMADDPLNCGGCANDCSDLQPNALNICRGGQCTYDDCQPGWVDRDGDQSNGCECEESLHGACDASRCIDFEIQNNGWDDDCDGLIDEADGPPNETRAHCGGPHASCLLTPGASDVDCVDGQCTAVPSGSPAVEPAREGCLNGLDEDHNGIIDDGPLCEILLPNRPRVDCQPPSLNRQNDASIEFADEGCQPASFAMGRSLGGQHSEHPQHDVILGHDVIIDRYEATNRQFAQYLHATEQCAANGEPHAKCDVQPERDLHPVDGITWCEAYDYCQWMGKRMPTEAEWARLARGTNGWTRARYPYPFSGMPLGWSPDDGSGIPPPRDLPEMAIAVCEEGVPVVAGCLDGPPATRPVTETGGWVVVGDLERCNTERGCDPAGTAAAVHVAGNVWEWTFDAFEDYCERIERMTGYPCREGLHEDNDAPREQRSPLPLLDPLLVGLPDTRRVLRGGGFGAEFDSIRSFNRLEMPPGSRVDSYGVRCARTFGSIGVDVTTRPYDSTRTSADWAVCSTTPPVGREVVGETYYTADFCSPELTDTDLHPRGPLVQSVVDSMIVAPPTALLMAHGPDEAGGRISVELGHAHRLDATWRWIADGDQMTGWIRCDADGHCTLDPAPPDDPRFSVWWNATERHDLRFDLVDLYTAPVDERPCGARQPEPGDVRWVAEVVVSADSPLSINAGDTLSSTICDNLVLDCVDPENTDQETCLQCPGWRLTLELLLRSDEP